MPGIDPERDVFPHTTARIHLASRLAPVASSVVTGQDFELAIPS